MACMRLVSLNFCYVHETNNLEMTVYSNHLVWFWNWLHKLAMQEDGTLACVKQWDVSVSCVR